MKDVTLNIRDNCDRSCGGGEPEAHKFACVDGEWPATDESVVLEI